MVTRYSPPRQGIAGQLFDVAFLLALVFGALFLPIWLKIAVPSRVEKLPEGVTYQAAADGTKTWTGLTWETLNQNPTMQAQWEKLGLHQGIRSRHHYPAVRLHDRRLGRGDHGPGHPGLFHLHAGHVGKEYKQVIAEKFD